MLTIFRSQTGAFPNFWLETKLEFFFSRELSGVYRRYLLEFTFMRLDLRLIFRSAKERDDNL